MPIAVSCPGCGARLKFPDAVAGRRGRCARCARIVEVPTFTRREEPQTNGGVGHVMGWRDFVAFRTWAAALVIRILFWLGLVGVLGAGIVLLIWGIRERSRDQINEGLALILVGPLVVRVTCETWILPFRIHETLTEIRDLLSHGDGHRGG